MKVLPADAQDGRVMAGIAASNEYSAKWSATNFEKEIKQPYAKIYKIEDEATQILAFICYRIAADTAELTNFAVERGSLRRGIGGFMLEHTLEILKIEGIKEVTLEVSKLNIPAIKLYERTLFKALSVRKKFYNNTDDAILMKRTL